MLDTPPQDKLDKHLYVFNACQQSCIMMVMGGSKMLKIYIFVACHHFSKLKL